MKAMGLELEFTAGDGPVIHNPVRDPADVDRIRPLTDPSPLGHVFEAVRLIAGVPAFSELKTARNPF